MIKYFKCTFKSDVILNTKISTEGKNIPLDYIPGAVFLGITAKNYKSYEENSFDVFHSGKVRFNDANLLINDQPSFKVPFAYFQPKDSKIDKKLKEDEIFVHNYIDVNLKESFKEKKIQLKQIRKGYINLFAEYKNIESTYSQKSAYDKSTRSSKDRSMFGFDAINKGTNWYFSVEFDDDLSNDLVNKVISDLIGIHSIGKSKTAQYGRCFIEEIDKILDYSELSDLKIKGNKIILYALSNLILVNPETGMFTSPTEKSLLLPDNCNILLGESQIRTRRYTPYNSTRKVRDYERLIIEKGSVISIEIGGNFDIKDYSEKIKRGVGAFLSEGFGKLLINPPFLSQLNPKFEKRDELEKEVVISGIDIKEDNNKDLIKWLDSKSTEKKLYFKTLDEVTNLINCESKWKKLKKVTLSQWGQFRAIATKTPDNKLYDALFNDDKKNEEDKGFCVHGKSKEQWKDVIGILKKEEHSSKFFELLAIEISRKIKAKKKEEGGN